MSDNRVEDSSKFDDDGRERTGTLLTTSAHIITTVIGSGVLSLAWAMAQLGWVIGSIALVAFSVITWFTSVLLAGCYKSPDGKRNYDYKDVVNCHLGGTKARVCEIVQHSFLVGVTVGSSITTSISMVAIKRAICFHKHGQQAGCHMSNNPFIASFGVIQLILSQIPDMHELSWLSVVAATMSFAYSFIGIGLSIAKIAEGGPATMTLTGVPIGKGMSIADKTWKIFSALGNIAFAYAFSPVLIEIQDTIKSGLSEEKVMKKAALIGISVSTVFYMTCGLVGYAAFGNNAPGNFLTGFGFYEPFWLVGFANLCIAIHVIGAYQVFAQPVFGFVENWSKKKWKKDTEESGFIWREYNICGLKVNVFRLVWRSTFVILTTILAMLFPFFNEFVGFLGSVSFWPLAVYFPVEMYIARTKTPTCSFTWISIQLLSVICLVISLLAAAGSIRGLAKALQTFKIFRSVS